ncbi:hypothetical protein [Pseudomonas putida]
MKDSLLLLITAVVVSFLAWAFWGHMGQEGFVLLNCVVIVSLMADNYRLRRQLKRNA